MYLMEIVSLFFLFFFACALLMVALERRVILQITFENCSKILCHYDWDTNSIWLVQLWPIHTTVSVSSNHGTVIILFVIRLYWVRWWHTIQSLNVGVSLQLCYGTIGWASLLYTLGWVGGTAGLTGVLLLLILSSCCIILHDTTWSSFVEVVHWTSCYLYHWEDTTIKDTEVRILWSDLHWRG